MLVKSVLQCSVHTTVREHGPRLQEECHKYDTVTSKWLHAILATLKNFWLIDWLIDWLNCSIQFNDNGDVRGRGHNVLEREDVWYIVVRGQGRCPGVTMSTGSECPTFGVCTCSSLYQMQHPERLNNRPFLQTYTAFSAGNLAPPFTLLFVGRYKQRGSQKPANVRRNDNEIWRSQCKNIRLHGSASMRMFL